MTRPKPPKADTVPQDCVFLQPSNQRCSGCGEPIRAGEFAAEVEQRVRCLACSGLQGHVFLPSGDPALTRRAGKLSGRAVAAVDWNQRRKRWERRGTLVEPDALAEAQAECAIDADRRALARDRSRVRAEAADQLYLQRFAEAIRTEFPGLPPNIEAGIAAHACEKHSGRVGRTAAAKELDRDMVTRAVIAHARHLHTGYDDLRDLGLNKRDSREQIAPEIQKILAQWRRRS